MPEDIRAITSGIHLPVNVLAHSSLTVAELGELRVRRVSSGSLPYRAGVADLPDYSLVNFVPIDEASLIVHSFVNNFRAWI